ncbi:MAG: hypothetical protein JO108_25510 [Acidobacteriaceae bacterium]|nr:hypothetical protein [Acidobacteriaceae bacterium]
MRYQVRRRLLPMKRSLFTEPRMPDGSSTIEILIVLVSRTVDVFTPDVIGTWLKYQRERELARLNLRPCPMNSSSISTYKPETLHAMTLSSVMCDVERGNRWALSRHKRFRTRISSPSKETNSDFCPAGESIFE